jgi:hypothetical protein
MQDGFRGNVSCWPGDAGPQGWWQFINHPTVKGHYLLSTSQWPECFVFMESGLFGGCRGYNKCDPGPQGYMKFVPHKDANGNEDGYYMMTPQKAGWEDKWFVYVENGFTGSLSSWSGDPGPQGWFKVEPWNTKINQAMDNIAQTIKRLPEMPMLGDPASGYNGPQAQLHGGQQQALSEIRLEASWSEGLDVQSLSSSQRSIVLVVDPNKMFSQKIGRLHQETFFHQLIPQREMLGSLSREIFELTLEPPNTRPLLKMLSSSMVLSVGDHKLSQGDTAPVPDGTKIRLSGNQNATPILVLTLYRMKSGGGRSESFSGVGGCVTGAVPRADSHAHRGSAPGYRAMDPAPPPVPSSPGYDGYNHVETRFEDARPGTVPQFHGDHSQGPLKMELECVYSAGNSGFNRASSVIQLIPEQEVAIGRQHQMGFFEKLLPDKDQLACISRKHLTARLRAGNVVEIENQSRNTVTIDHKTIGQYHKGELRENASLRFIFRDMPLLEFRLKREGGVPPTRFG